MPLFGSKKKDPDTSKSQQSGYPSQSSAYPLASAPPCSEPAGPPPPYAPPPTGAHGYPLSQPQPPQAPQPYPAPQPFQGYPAQGHPSPMGGYPPQGYPAAPAQQQPYPYTPVQQTVEVQGGFAAGARFDGAAQPRIPPPPPGVAPNAAQMAAMQGHQVLMTQQKTGFWSDGTGQAGTSWGL